ncbi:hypothetical protein Desor_4744 [Desulfosporosinus orientis DSM 765]|uniref:Uncharacterized protein n=1 Tax=Desulfosporosinus orientis (strain ATCC 19365 / DSM 765 / NCIMB 8382 / VKM B-1628 / Singapore I) TaxID=768706 RepID=G7WG54_DESOD|nr:hypothetical protein [Desulfosporosinus orientis]AET70148.1 hypothetical protein Desor_4744 [Desulfosporosinus orientis DSM 765]
MNAVTFSLAILLAGLVIVFIIAKLGSKVIKLLSWKICALTAGVYIGLLILSYPLLCLLPDNDFIKSAQQRDETVAATQSLLNALYHEPPILNEETIAHSKGVFKNSSRSFPFSSHQISLNIQQGPGNHHIFIKKKETSDGIIDVSTYVTAHYIGNVDFSKQVSPPTIILKDNMMHLIFPNLQTMNYQQINYDFTLSQFKAAGDNGSTMRSHYGEQLVYIRVPKNIELNIPKDQPLIHEID